MRAWSKVSGPGEAVFANPADGYTTVSFRKAGTYVLQFAASDSELVTTQSFTIQVIDPGDGSALLTAGCDFTAFAGQSTGLPGWIDDDQPWSDLTVAWQVLEGPGTVTFGDPAQPNSTATFSAPGVYRLALNARDSTGWHSDEVFVTVLPPPDINQPPVIQLPPAFWVFHSTNPVPLTATLQDDGLPAGTLTWLWQQTSGPAAATLLTPSGTGAAPSALVTFTLPGVYTFSLTAGDSALNTTNETLEVRVVEPASAVSNNPPTVNAGSDRLTTVGAIFFTSATITDDNAVAYSWTQLSGPAPAPVSYAGASFPDARLGFTAPGEYRFRLTASDSAYAAGDDVVINVQSAANAAPIARYRPIEHPTAGGPTFLRAVISDDCHPDNTGLSAQWHPWYGPGTVTFGNQTLTPLPGGGAIEVLTEATFTQPGNYGLRLHVSDGSLAADYYYTVAVFAPVAPNDPPLANAGPDQTVATSAWFDLTGSVSDDGLPAGGLLSASWSLASGPGPVYFHGAAATNTQAQVPVAGVYVFRLSASDGEQTAVDDVTITAVAPTNRAPFVFAGNDFSVTRPNASSLQGLASDDGLPAGYPLVVEWSQVAGPAGVVLAVRTNAVTSVTFPTSGAYVLRLTAFDGQLTSTDDVSVTVIEGTNAPPMVNAGADIAALVNTPATLSGSATDDGLPNGFLQSAWSQVSGPGTARVTTLNGAYRVTADTAGAYVLRLSATDGALSASDDVTVTVHASVLPPVVAITAPLDAGEITAPTLVLGTADRPLLASWVLEYRLADSSSSSFSNWSTLASATTNVVNNTLGLLDPTLSLNGIYELRLTATDQIGRTSMTDPVTVVFDRNMKVGHFSMSFSDLKLPVAGIPIEIIRTYDSRDKRTGDFGVGWTLGLKNIRLQKNRNLGANWYQDTTGGFFPSYSMNPRKERRVTITFPDGKVFKFTAKLNPESQFGVPITAATMVYEPTPETYGALAAFDGDDVFVAGSVPGLVDCFDYEGGSYNPTLFRLTTHEGDAYVIDERDGLKSLTDRHGNSLTITTNGIIHSSGKSVLFQRDSLGRITNIVDAAGHAMRYAYDTNGDLATFTDRENQSSAFTYDGTHRLLTFTDPRGVTPLRNEYDDSGRLVRQIDGQGRATEFTHDLNNRFEIIRDRLGNVTAHLYDGNGNVTDTIDALGHETQFTYDQLDNQLSKTDALGNTTTWTYDARGNKLTETDGVGTTRWTYDAFNQITSITDPRGNLTTNAYDPDTGNLTRLVDALGNATAFTYDGQGNILTRTNALGNVTTNAYDASGHLTNVVVRDVNLGVLNVTAFAYDANGNQTNKTTWRTTPQGVEALITSFVYDQENRLVQTILPDGSTAQTVHNEIDKPAVEIDPLGRQTRHDYDAQGNLTKTTFPDGTFELMSYDAENRKVSLTDRAGRETAYGYDPLARMTNTVYADGSATNLVLDALGRLVATVDERGNTNWFEYDPNCACSGRQTKVTNPLGQETRYSYDPNGNQVSLTDALGRTTGFVYDVLDRRIQTVFPDGTFTTTHYDAVGRRVAETDQSGVSTWFGYDALGRLTSVTTALGGVTRYAYDEVGNLVSQTDANNHTTTYEYDALGRRTRRTLPGGQTETYAYNLAGNLIRQTDFNGDTTTFTYDAADRLLTKVPDPRRGEPTVGFTYTPTGRRASMTDASGGTTYAYDLRDRLTQKTVIFGGASYTSSLTYTRDVAGNLTRLQSSTLNGADVSYEYDALNRLSAVTDSRLGRTAYAFDAAGNLQGYTYPNGVGTTHQYDSLNRLTNVVAINSQPSTLSQFRYTLHPTGHRLSVAELGGRTVGYAYDALYRLTGETVAGAPNAGAAGYTLDPVGNRLQRTSSLPGVANQSFGYDANTDC